MAASVRTVETAAPTAPINFEETTTRRMSSIARWRKQRTYYEPTFVSAAAYSATESRKSFNIK
jgi:hypothetical protein